MIIFISLIALVLCHPPKQPNYSPTYSGPQWQGQTCPFKQAALLSEVNKDKTPNGWYGVRLPEILIESMNTSFDSVMDDMPAQNLFNLEERPKLIHSVGAIATCRFVSNGQHNYTGVFQGSETAFIRFSLAKKPSASPPNVVPGISLKFMRTGVPSANVFAMYSLEGQTSFNFFEHDITNHPPFFNASQADIFAQLLFKAFRSASNWPTLLGLNALARYDSNGKPAINPIFPYRIVFHPTKYYHNLFPSTPQTDDSYFIPQFESMAPGPVYDVYAIATPGASPRQIGTIETTSVATGTKWGDHDMFFQHTRMEDDIALRPEWLPGMQAILDEQGRQYPPVPYPDLPFN